MSEERMERVFCHDCDTEIDPVKNPKQALYEMCSSCQENSNVVSLSRIDREKRLDEVSKFARLSVQQALKQFGVPRRAAENAEKYWLASSEKLRQFLKGSTATDSFYLSGPAGTGKTVLAAAILYKYAQEFSSGNVKDKGIFQLEKFVYQSVPDLLYKLRQTYKRSDDSEDLLVGKMKRASMLVLDDLGAEKSTDWTLSVLYLIVDSRYQSYRPTIFTSNLPLKDLVERMDDARIASRIHGWCTIKSMEPTDLRKQ